eukprot:6186094-Pleurochrysis_carterae.AAC.2
MTYLTKQQHTGSSGLLEMRKRQAEGSPKCQSRLPGTHARAASAAFQGVLSKMIWPCAADPCSAVRGCGLPARRSAGRAERLDETQEHALLGAAAAVQFDEHSDSGSSFFVSSAAPEASSAMKLAHRGGSALAQ